MMQKSAVAVVAVLGVAFLATPNCVYGVDYTFTNSPSGAWIDAGSWSPAGGPPGAADNAILGAGIGNGLTCTIGPGETADVKILRVGAWLDKTGTLEITGGQLTAYDTGNIGNVGHGTLNQSGGAFNAGGRNMWFGTDSRGTGIYTVTGGSFTNMDLMHVGRYGHGTLVLDAPGVVQGKPLANVFIGRYAGSTGLMAVTAGGPGTTAAGSSPSAIWVTGRCA